MLDPNISNSNRRKLARVLAKGLEFEPDEPAQSVGCLEVITAHNETSYLGFIDSRRGKDKRGVNLPAFYIFEDPVWIMAQNDSLQICLRENNGVLIIASLGKLREQMRGTDRVVLTIYETYKRILEESGVRPYESQRPKKNSSYKAK